MGELVTKFNEWVKRPFSPEMSAVNWALFIGLVLVIIIGWKSIIEKVLDQ